MSQSAKIHSIDALREFKATFCTLTQSARAALDVTRMDIRRFRNWLQCEQLEYWKTQLKRRERDVAEARTLLQRKKLSGGFQQSAPATEEKRLVRRAEERLQEAEQKVRNIKRWTPIVERAIQQFEGNARQLARVLEVDAANGVAVLEQKLSSLSAYVMLGPPGGRAASPSVSNVQATIEDSATSPPTRSSQHPAADEAGDVSP